MLQALSPGVQDHESANSRAQACRVGRDAEQRFRRGLKQEVVRDAFIGQREARQRLRHREDAVHIAHRQQFLLARRHPGVAGGGEALGTMPIPTAVVREGRLRALVAAIAVSAECRRSTLGDGPEDAPMVPGHPGAVCLQEMIAVLAHDVGPSKGGRVTAGASAACVARCQGPRGSARPGDWRRSTRSAPVGSWRGRKSAGSIIATNGKPPEPPLFSRHANVALAWRSACGLVRRHLRDEFDGLRSDGHSSGRTVRSFVHLITLEGGAKELSGGSGERHLVVVGGDEGVDLRNPRCVHHRLDALAVAISCRCPRGGSCRKR